MPSTVMPGHDGVKLLLQSPFIPAQAGIQISFPRWVPASAGTNGWGHLAFAGRNGWGHLAFAGTNGVLKCIAFPAFAGTNGVGGGRARLRGDERGKISSASS